MKILVIPDVHLRHDVVDSILAKETFDKVICLGDIFDDFGDTPRRNAAAARWLKPLLHDERFTFVMGNHDLYYAAARPGWFACSGYTPEKYQAINEVLTRDDWARFKWFHFAEGYLFSHAGLSARLLPSHVTSVAEYLRLQSEMANNLSRVHCWHWFYQVGRRRGGQNPCGGLLWCDLGEFEGIEGLPQIFGHTPLDTPFVKEGGVCLDTHLKHYGIIRDGILTIKNS